MSELIGAGRLLDDPAVEVAGEDQSSSTILASPGRQDRQGIKDMLGAVNGNRPVLTGDVEHPFDSK